MQSHITELLLCFCASVLLLGCCLEATGAVRSPCVARIHAANMHALTCSCLHPHNMYTVECSGGGAEQSMATCCPDAASSDQCNNCEDGPALTLLWPCSNPCCHLNECILAGQHQAAGCVAGCCGPASCGQQNCKQQGGIGSWSAGQLVNAWCLEGLGCARGARRCPPRPRFIQVSIISVAAVA